MQSRLRPTLLLLGLLALPRPSSAQQDTTYAIRPGDKVTVELFTAAGERVAVVEGERTVDRNGDVYLPYAGTVHLAGLDQSSLRELLVESYRPFYADPVLNVTVALRVTVTGAVASPGQFFLDPTATLIDALAAAGGANTEYIVAGTQIPGDPRETRVVREGERLTINLHPADITDETLNFRIRSGDWLHVPPEDRTAIRDEVLFWGSLLSLVSGVASLIILIGR